MISIAGPFDECREAVRNGLVACPDCGHGLAPRGFAPPLGPVRGAGVIEGLGPGGERIRARCGGCGKSHTLLPPALAAHRADTVQVLGEAVAEHAANGTGAARIAAMLGRPVRTVAGWLADARTFAARHLPGFIAMLAWLGVADQTGVVPDADPVRELLAVLEAIHAAAARRWGNPGVTDWDAVNLICRGRFISGSLHPPFYPGLAYPGMA